VEYEEEDVCVHLLQNRVAVSISLCIDCSIAYQSKVAVPIVLLVSVSCGAVLCGVVWCGVTYLKKSRVWRFTEALWACWAALCLLFMWVARS
jgi:hypothetical protein